MRKHWRRTLSLLAVAAALGLVSAGLALGKKPPKPPPEPPPPEPVVTVSYSIRYLGALPGDTSSRAEDLNIHGEVVGLLSSPDGNRAFLYSDRDGDGIKEMVALNDLMSDADRGQWDLTIARGINDAGQIAGSGYFNGEYRAFRLTPGLGEEPAVVENLGTLGGDSSGGYGINNQGHVTGGSSTSTGEPFFGQGFIWTKEGGMSDIGDLYGWGNKSVRINNSGETTGDVWLGRGDVHAFRYTPAGGMEDLGDFGADEIKFPLGNEGRDINDDGYVVGAANNLPKVRGASPKHAFLYTDHMIDLGTLGGYYSRAYGVNSFCHVVGTSRVSLRDATYYGFLYTDITDTGEFVMVKLEDLIVNLPPDYVGPMRPWKINDFGQICGQADGEAILLTPVEP